eukprot:TRINITY_DN55461_c0_g1_i1.p1 TRINITY_DN55461_c0_g1~~TRINITY_DN55461_c0_g1_i1.p1  ORF type:complete len:269 (-),score=38.07 TRINITY_DN55461_c0_g1_i1:206-1012(-)
MGGSSAVLGNILNTLILLQSIFYTALTVGHAAGKWSLDAFGQNWAKDGFCLSFKDTLYHTHLLCLYGDVFFVVLLYLCVSRSDRSEITWLKKGIPSIFMHGMGHGYLWYFTQYKGGFAPGQVFVHEGLAPVEVALSLVLLFGFWMSFLSVEWPLPFAIAQSAVHVVLLAYQIPLLLAFTYVNGVLNFNFAGKALLNGQEGIRDKYYLLTAILILLPINAAAWAEPLFCDTFLVHWGGHVLFDYSIPLGQLAYLAVALALPPRSKSKGD